MTKTIICKNCDKEKPANIRLKGTQKYCGDSDCQRARKAAWQKQKMDNDAEYYVSQKHCVEQWRETKPAHQYQNQYRQHNLEYVSDNRKKQRIRNRKRRTQIMAKKIVKMDALDSQLEKSNSYIMTRYTMDASKKIVKMDTFLVELTVFQGDRQAFFSNFP